MDHGNLALVPAPPELPGKGDSLPGFQDRLLRQYAEYCECLNFSSKTVAGYLAHVRSALRDLELAFVWELTAEEVRRYNLLLVERGLAVGTRRSYCTAIKSLFEFLVEEHAAEIATVTGVSIRQPVTRRNTPRIRYCESFDRGAPPSRGQVRKVSRLLRERLHLARAHEVAARNLVVFETLYLTAMRANELLHLDVEDLHFGKGAGGQVHVRVGKGTRGSGPRSRWAPMLDGLGDLLGWYVRQVRPKLGPSRRQRALFVSTDGKRLTYDGAGDILDRCLAEAKVRKDKRFTLHRLRHARASHLFADGMNLVAIQKLLGHEFITTTQRYVHVDATFVAQAHKAMVQRTLREARR